jgi:fumarylacetoacetase
MGQPIPISNAEENLFGLVLMNDWSARDIQTWEYIPLGPFNAKNFGTTISPWVVLTDALEPFRAKGLENKTEMLPYLKESRENTVYDIRLEVDLTSMNSFSFLMQISLTHPKHHLVTLRRSHARHPVTSFGHSPR